MREASTSTGVSGGHGAPTVTGTRYLACRARPDQESERSSTWDFVPRSGPVGKSYLQGDQVKAPELVIGKGSQPATGPAGMPQRSPVY